MIYHSRLMSYNIHKLTGLPARALSSFSKASGDDVQCEGWLLKKRRRKNQGYARRYFVLRASGFLSYALHSQLPPREQFGLSTAVISSNVTRREIHIDCESGIYHIKASSAGDFEMWMTAFRGNLGQKIPATRPPRSFSSSNVRARGQSSSSAYIHKLHSQSIQSLEDTVKIMKNEEQKGAVGQFKLKTDYLKDREGIRHLFRRSSSGPSSLHMASDVTGSSLTDQLQQTLGLLKLQFERLCTKLSHPDTNISSAPETFPDRTMQPIPQKIPSHRESILTFLSSGDGSSTNVWFDAPEGPEEFVITDDSTTPSSELVEVDLYSSDSINEANYVDATDEGDIGDAGSSESGHTQRRIETLQVERRTILPGKFGNEISLFALLRKNIGKDLSTISFPVTSNEPLGLLQRLAEDMEYAELLTQAYSTSDPLERMCLVAAFAVSGFACTRLRSGRKPFTPMLGETFEDNRTRFIAEKVSNHPLIIASHAEGNGWEWWATNAGKNHFWGKSLEIEQTGLTHLRIGDDHYQWSKPSSFIRNLMVGTKYLEHVGSLSIENKANGARCVIEFQEAGYWGTPNLLSGTAYSPKGNIEARLEGTWHEQLSQVLSDSHLKVLWRANVFPKHAPRYYGLTSFATTLNEITTDIEGKLPPTDTRYRPDLRALEEGDVILAEAEKARVEIAQRERRARGTEVEPRWFKKVGPDEYAYNGGYWEQRTKGWTGSHALW
ncbi:hypothetical protein K439DRAFT_1549545 [Ramaria rubella]|nr:hypothetical protein K439DRAFT_1549545 [Ramaria rubella]